MKTDPVLLRIMLDTFASIPEEMGRTLQRTAFSPNIKERMDASCALFDGNGSLLAQAEHIPVHLGAMPLVVTNVLEVIPDLGEDDMIVVNDPSFGGTHLPDITVILPVFREGERIAFLVNRAHHADIGGTSPGSMPAHSSELFQEGLIIPPVRLLIGGKENEDIFRFIKSNTRTPEERIGDLRAQISACFLGKRRYLELVERYGLEVVEFYGYQAKEYSRTLIRKQLSEIPDGSYHAIELIEQDRFIRKGEISENEARIEVLVTMNEGRINVDFTGTSPESDTNINAPRAVTLSTVFYVIKCIAGSEIPHNEGCFSGINVIIPENCLLNPSVNRAVCAGNVETSQKIAEALFTAFSSAQPGIVPAGSQGTMNNIIIGGRGFSYYETLGGGEGAHSWRNGADGIHTNMTNTANTPIEALELVYPLRILEYSLIKGSGGGGKYRGGNGLRRVIEFLGKEGKFSIISGNRRFAPSGRNGGDDGRSGKNVLIRDSEWILPGSVDLDIRKGDVIIIETPGGGGWGSAINSK